MKRRSFTPDQKKEIVRQIVRGESPTQVLKQHDLYWSTLIRWRDEFEKEVKKEEAASRANGAQPKAPETNTESTPSNVPVVLGKGNKLPVEMQAKLREKIQAGEKGPAIAAALGINITSVYYYKKKWAEGGSTDDTGEIAQAGPLTITSSMSKFAERMAASIVEGCITPQGVRIPTPGETSALALYHMLHGKL